jgi:hypothetical protein
MIFTLHISVESRNRAKAIKGFVVRRGGRRQRLLKGNFIRPASNRIRSPVIASEVAEARNNAASSTAAG